MQVTEAKRERIARSRLDWLVEQSAAWRDQGLLDEPVRQQILGRYDAESAERRGMRAVIVLAILMCGVGVALLIGYNWDRIPSVAKVTMLLSFVATAFGASAAAYARGRNTAGELLAFAGTLLFGNAIWLIAQVLHIEGHYPDAFLWFAIGALAGAHLLKSTWISIEAAVLVFAWVVAEGTSFVGPNFPYLAIAPVVVLAAYRARTPVVIAIAAFTTGIWAFVFAIDESPAIAVGAIALFGCAFHAVGRLDRDRRFMLWWQVSGLGVLLCAFVPLLITGFHREAVEGRLPDVVTIAFGAVVAVAALAVAFLRRLTTAAASALMAVCVAVPVWTAVHITVLRAEVVLAPRLATIMYSILALAVAVTLIRSALRSSRASDLALGVLFALVFLIVRWADVIDNLFWSGLFLLAAGGGLLLVARLWHHRDRSLAEGSLS